MKTKFLFGALALFLSLTIQSPAPAADWLDEVKTLANGGAVLVVDAQGQTLVSINPDKPLVPASTLKVVTAAVALDALGPEYRFKTDFHLSPEGDLYVKGYGDPYLISEELTYLTAYLKNHKLDQIRDIYLDNSWFTPGLVLHGTERSLNPYDAYNGALCVNFNTIYVKIAKNGEVTSAEPQTPLTDMAREMAAKTKARGKVRFNLAENPETCLRYAGELLKTFLEMADVKVTGRIRFDRGAIDQAPLFLRYYSRIDLAENFAQLFEYSNNFMTNQIWLTIGAEKYGPPADPAKSRKVVADYFTKKGIPAFHMEEGSGLSRRTKITALQMMAVLADFKPYQQLLVRSGSGRVLYKTGTLRDVKSMVGYLIPKQGDPLSFVILLNGGQFTGRTRGKILDLLEKNLL